MFFTPKCYVHSPSLGRVCVNMGRMGALCVCICIGLVVVNIYIYIYSVHVWGEGLELV